MKYRILTTDTDILCMSYYLPSYYIENGLRTDEIKLINKFSVNNWEEALNCICENLNFKLISVYPGKNHVGYPRLIYIFEEVNDNNILM